MLLLNVGQAARLLGPLVRARPEEWLAIAFLGASGEVLTVMSRRGGIDNVELPGREIASEGLRLGSCAMVVAHNHPSGDCTPSQADLAATRRLAQIGEAIDVRLHDHLVFGSGSYSSMRALGLL